MTTAPNPLLVPGIAAIYPESDGAPLGETEAHVHLTLNLFAALRQLLGEQRRAYVGCNMFVYYREGDPRRVVCPDLFVAFGVKPGVRRTFKVWEEGTFPQVIIEVTSKDSQLDDTGAKPGLYAKLGVDEYFIIDPLGEYLSPPLVAMRRRGDRMVEAPNRPSPPYRCRFPSRRLGVDVCLGKEGVRLVSPKTGEVILWPNELASEVERLRREIAKLRAEKRRR